MIAGAVVNFIIAMLVAGVVFGAINRMNGVTSHAIRCSILLLFISMLGQAFAIPLKQWDYWTDTLLYGAVASFVVASRRLPTEHGASVPHPKASAAAFAIIGATLVVAFVLGHL